MYAAFHPTKAAFPESSLEWRELIFFRSWQAESLVKIFYYLILIVGLVHAITLIVVETIINGAGGFFLGLLYGVLAMFLYCIVGRITAEMFLSVFVIRDCMDHSASARGGSSAPDTTQPPPPEVHSAPSGSGYQSQQYDNL